MALEFHARSLSSKRTSKRHLLILFQSMVERILVAFDGSEHAELALNHAIELARLANASIKIVTVVENVLADVNSPEFNVSAVKAEIAVRARNLLERARLHAQESRVEAQSELILEAVRASGVSHYIEDAAKAFKADLIVIGAFGLRGVRPDMIGSNALAALHIAGKNVTVVR